MESKNNVFKIILGLVIGPMVPFIIVLSLVILVVMFFMGTQSGGNQGSPGYALAYSNAVVNITRSATVPDPLMLSLIGWESGGNWRSVNQNSNGTTDAGLCQINSVNWSTYGLSNNPFDVRLNVSASASILGNELRVYNNDWTKALYGYNGGSYENGLKYNPQYAPHVLDIFRSLYNQDVFAKVVSINEFSGTVQLIVAEQSGQGWTAPDPNSSGLVSGKDFTNPSSFVVTDSMPDGSLVGSSTVLSSPGDGGLFSPEAVLYNFTISGVRKNDTLMVLLPDGKSTSISLKVIN